MRTICLTMLLLAGCSAPLTPALQGVDVALLGETHDNVEHHLGQAEAVRKMGADALVFEMIPRSHEAAANAVRASGDLTALEAALDWRGRFWPPFKIYAPIFEAAPQARIYGAEVDRDALRSAMHDGLAEAGARIDLSPALRLMESFAAAENAALAAEIETAHCGMMDAETARRMTAAQRLRDAALADAALRAREDGAARIAVIAGNGHARLAPGAVQYLRRAAPELRVVSIGFLEEGQNPPGDFDLIRRTPARKKPDPCAAFSGRAG